MEAVNNEGKNQVLTIDGQTVYMGVVTLVNIKILTSTNTHTGWSLFFALGSISIFVLYYYLVNLIPSNEIYKAFVDQFA